jgi:hypothetical protein
VATWFIRDVGGFLRQEPQEEAQSYSPIRVVFAILQKLATVLPSRAASIPGGVRQKSTTDEGEQQSDINDDEEFEASGRKTSTSMTKRMKKEHHSSHDRGAANNAPAPSLLTGSGVGTACCLRQRSVLGATGAIRMVPSQHMQDSTLGGRSSNRRMVYLTVMPC